MRVSYLFLLLFALTFSACGGDDDEVTIDPENNLLLGTWIATSGVQTGTTKTSFGGVDIEADFRSELVTPTDYGITFTANPNELVVIGNPELKVTYTVNGMPTTQGIPVPLPLDQNSTWETNGDNLRVDDGQGQVTDITIAELTETKLSLTATVKTSANQGGAVAETTSNFNYSYERQQ